jgi:hypothetical protein
MIYRVCSTCSGSCCGVPCEISNEAWSSYGGRSNYTTGYIEFSGWGSGTDTNVATAILRYSSRCRTIYPIKVGFTAVVPRYKFPWTASMSIWLNCKTSSTSRSSSTSYLRSNMEKSTWIRCSDTDVTIIINTHSFSCTISFKSYRTICSTSSSNKGYSRVWSCTSISKS